MVWTLFAMGSFSGLIPWIVMGISLATASGAPGAVPTPYFVYVVYFVMVAFYVLFAAVFVLSTLRIGPWADYTYTEACYMFLSAVAKTTIAWQTYLGQ